MLQQQPVQLRHRLHRGHAPGGSAGVSAERLVVLDVKQHVSVSATDCIKSMDVWTAKVLQPALSNDQQGAPVSSVNSLMVSVAGSGLKLSKIKHEVGPVRVTEEQEALPSQTGPH